MHERKEAGHAGPLLSEASTRLVPPPDEERQVEDALYAGTDRLFTCDSRVGKIYVGASKTGVRLLGRASSPQEFARRYRERFKRLLSWEMDDSTRALAESTEEALAGQIVQVPADLSGVTPFQRRVLETVSLIPRGEVRSYTWVAREAGSPRASRAVGSVMASNPVPLLIPCHRVIRNDGGTGGYAFGAEAKAELLRHEGVRPGRPAR